jgi:hypothetical protein
MNLAPFDVDAFIRAVAIALGVGFLGSAITYFVTRTREEWVKRGAVLFQAMIGIVILLTVAIYFLWPTLVKVPSLDGLSRAEAEDLLVKNGLIPQGRPQYATEVEAGRVIPHSQSPSYGLTVRPGTTVSFALSIHEEGPPITGDPLSGLTVSIYQPKSGEKVRCFRGADGVYRFSASGTSSGVPTGGFGLLLWLKPVNPPSDTPGWYLQRTPVNGIAGVKADGSWTGMVQLGNAQYPPNEGDMIDLAVTIVDNNTVNRLMGEPGVVVRNEPVGIKSHTASGVIATLK